MSAEMTPDAKAREIAEKIVKNSCSVEVYSSQPATIERLKANITAALTRSEEEKDKLNEQQQKEGTCAICYHMFAPEFLEENVCSLCLNQQLSTLTARLKGAERIIEALRREAGYRSIKTAAMLDAESFLTASTPVEKEK